MSNATHGGKGDRDRTADKEKFWDNYDKIFRKGGPNLEEKPAPVESSDESWLDDMLDDDLDNYITSYVIPPSLTDVEIERKLKEWGMMYDCLQNIHLYEYPVEEARALLKQIKNNS